MEILDWSKGNMGQYILLTVSGSKFFEKRLYEQEKHIGTMKSI